MLPGFRFLFAAIVLSTSILIFGLGAAALLRAAHEEFSSIPSRRAPPETVFAQPNEASAPVLAMLRIDEPVVEKASDDVLAAAAPVEQSEMASTPAEPERIAALKPEDSPLPEAAKPEFPVAESLPPSEPGPAEADAPSSTEQTREAAAGAALPPANEAVAVAPEPANAPASLEADPASAKIATLGGPPVAIETQAPAKATSTKPDRSAIKKRLQARRAAQRRKIAARIARPAAPQQADPFAQPTITPRSR